MTLVTDIISQNNRIVVRRIWCGLVLMAVLVAQAQGGKG